MNRLSIETSNLSKTYRGCVLPALLELNLKICEGEIFGMIGPNGAGKTTLFSLLSGILDASQGQISICGLTMQSNKEKIKKLFGIVPQDIALYPTISGRHNLLFIGRMYGMKEADLRDKIDYYLDLFNVSSFQHNATKTYSGGTKRKFNLIGGLLHQPKVLLLDEPTVGVDVQTRLSIMSHLQLINQNENITILYTSHYLEQAQEFCNRIGILNEGRLIKVGSPDELMKSEHAADLESVFLKLTSKDVS